ncbi:hypothetical protein [Alicyclobacillus sendaiensis]|uniref:hypothetical protein n=1 Tax=Alicyclobacillus sendaiensis TaxID=192387 RepID=UPI0026F42E91|nr:hypothetical protein [Alicyclobacillus sendaiensis]
MRKSRKYPDEYIMRLMEYIDEHPGMSIEEVIELSLPYFLQWYDPERAKRAALMSYIRGALRRVKLLRRVRAILPFRKEVENGKHAIGHAIYATVDDPSVILKQLELRREQVVSLLEEIRFLERTYEYRIRYGKSAGTWDGNRIVLDEQFEKMLEEAQ